MPQFRHHNTGQVHSTSSEDETATYDDDPVWQRIDDDEEPASEPAADDAGSTFDWADVDAIAAELEQLSPDQRDALREALERFADQTMVEIGGQRMTEAQFNAAQFPLLSENQLMSVAANDETEEAEVEQTHPGFDEPLTAVEHPADGTQSPEISNDPPARATRSRNRKN